MAGDGAAVVGNVDGKGLNLAQCLRDQAARTPHRRALIVPAGRARDGRAAWAQLTFAQLERETDRYAHGLARIGIRRGTRVTLMVKPGIEFLAVTFALFKLGAVVVLVDPGMGMKSLGICLAEAAPEAFIGIPLAQVARLLLGWARASLRLIVTAGRRWFWGGHRLADCRADAPTGPDGQIAPWPIEPFAADEMAAIFFSSGSTGVAKGAVYTHGILTNQVRILRNDYGFADDEVDMATFPLFALLDLAIGITVIVPDMDATKPAAADPERLREALEDHGATMMFGSPALVDTLSRYGVAHGMKLPGLRRVISCGAPARNDVLARMQQLLPPTTQIFTPYGATEALPVATIGSHAILGGTAAETEAGGGTCVGVPNPDVTVAVIGITDDPIPVWRDDLRLPPGAIGEIVVRGPIVTREYYARPEATALAKIRDADGRGVWHRMGDVGRFDTEGRLWFCGRKTHRVRTPTGTLYTIPVERVFNRHPKVFRTALVGVPGSLDQAGRPAAAAAMAGPAEVGTGSRTAAAGGGGGPADAAAGRSSPPTGPEPAGDAKLRLIGAERGDQLPVLCVELEAAHRNADPAQIRRELLEIGAGFDHTSCITHVLFHPGFPVDIRHNAKISREQLALWAAAQLRR